MNLKQIMNARFCLSIGAALTVATVLGAQRTGPAPDADGAGVVYVYYTSVCAAPGDSRHCEEIRRPVRPSFETMSQCSAHADEELKRAHDLRLMASCLKQRES